MSCCTDICYQQSALLRQLLLHARYEDPKAHYPNSSQPPTSKPPTSTFPLLTFPKTENIISPQKHLHANKQTQKLLRQLYPTTIHYHILIALLRLYCHCPLTCTYSRPLTVQLSTSHSAATVISSPARNPNHKPTTRNDSASFNAHFSITFAGW